MNIRFNIYKYIEVFLLIFASVSPLITNTTRVIIISLLILVNIKYLRKFNKDRSLLIIGLISLLFIFSGILDLSNINSITYSVLNIYFPICFILGYIVHQKYTLDEYIGIFDRIIFISAIFSILGTMLIIYLPSALQYLPFYTYGGYVHRTAYVFNVLYADGYLIARNSGFAREPGIYQILLNIGLMASISEKNKWQLLKLVIYGLAIILTKSTIGLVIYIFIIMRIIREVPKARLLLVIAILIFFKEVYEAIIYQTTYKLVGSNSFDVRFTPMINAYTYGLRNVFGIGNTGYDAIYLNFDLGSWDSFSQIFLRYGYLLFGFIVYLYVNIFKKNILLFIIIAVTSFSQNIWYLVMITPIYFMCLNSQKEIKGVGGNI